MIFGFCGLLSVNLSKLSLHLGHHVGKVLAGFHGLTSAGVGIELHERSLHGLDLRHGVVDGIHGLRVKLLVVALDIGVQREDFVSLAFHATHVGVLDAGDVVVKVGDGLLAVGKY